MANFQQSEADFKVWKERVLTQYPELAEDPEFLLDTLDGCTDFLDALRKIARSHDEDVAMSEGIGERIAQMKERLDRLQMRAIRKRAVVESAMLQNDIDKLSLPEMSLSITNRPASTVILDEAAIPEEFFKPQQPKLDRAALTAALKSGKVVTGAVLNNGGRGLTIRRT